MPYEAKKQGNVWCVVDQSGKDIACRHDSKYIRRIVKLMNSGMTYGEARDADTKQQDDEYNRYYAKSLRKY